MANENSFSISGTIYAKEFTEVRGVKDPSQTYPKNLLTLEIKTSREKKEADGKVKYITTTDLPQFEFFGINLDDFSVGDYVEVRFSLSGREYKKKDGTKGTMTKLAGRYIKYADLDAPRSSNKGKVTVTSMTNPDELKIKEVFKAPEPDAVDDYDDQLPF